MKADRRREIPSVDRVLRDLSGSDVPRAALAALIRRELSAIRAEGQSSTTDEVIDRVRAAVEELHRSRLRPVINGTGIIIHTNLGRSPLGAEVVRTLTEIGANYNNLEYDLAGGERGGRAAYLEHNLAVLCGAGAATVVNNCAAALVLVLRHFTAGEQKQVLISRGELVQIGGGFRVPDILEAAGAQLREVGTTNRTVLSDYARAAGKSSALILKVHRGNFYMGGFVESPEPEELAALARGRKLSFVEDLGSGAMMRTEDVPGVAHEPTPAEALRRGADLVCFSGDKLLGGPQAGIIAGKPKLVAALKRDPFFRALRCDKLILGALQTTVDLHLGGQREQIPTAAMLCASVEELGRRARMIASALEGLGLRTEVGKANSQVGGGTLPGSTVASVSVDVFPRNLPLTEFAARLRKADPPLIGYVSGRRFRLDLRTIFPRQDEQIVQAIRSVLPMSP